MLEHLLDSENKFINLKQNLDEQLIVRIIFGVFLIKKKEHIHKKIAY